MPRNVDYGEAIAILQVNQKLRDDWGRRDGDADLPGNSSRLTVRNLEHAQVLAVSCAKIWAEYEQENVLRGPKRGRKPGSGFKTVLEDLMKLIEANPESKQYTSADVATELGDRTKGNKAEREKKEAVRERRRRRPKGTLEVYRPESHKDFTGIALQVAIPVDYGEWTSGECAFMVHFEGVLVFFGEGSSRDEAWNDLCRNMAANALEFQARLRKDNTDEKLSEEDARLSRFWIHGFGSEDILRDTESSEPRQDGKSV